jgi:hypothetical protein
VDFREEYFRLVGLGVISSAAIFDENGGLFWISNQDWAVDGFSILSGFATFPPFIYIAGIKYMVLINGFPDYCLLKSLVGFGTIVIVRTSPNYFLVTWTPAEAPFDPMDILAEVQKMAELFK